ncbi:lysine--tRNA ligase [Spirochaetia bacterium]|nr:lysine--tRNA ligase [Spirochaetia bacterium]GHU32845.1 lysine--tRNA ligase [Spirochaetia bacterium]
MDQHVLHWADETAAKILSEKGEKDCYVCASGITPSGTVHIGNFREIISVDLVARALADKGKKLRFIYSWDDYDVFRKVPANMPHAAELQKYLRFPITLVPDPWERDSSYARHHEVDVETVLPAVGIHPEYLYQAERYRSAMYGAGVRVALEKRALLKEILNEFRDEDHKMEADYWPITVFCGKCNRDTTEIDDWDGEWGLSYHCNCGQIETVDLRESNGVKLLWRIDWPMRWKQEQVDFEPAGKDHHSPGGSFDTARRVSREVYGYEPPVTFRYDFIGTKGLPGKMSSSSGNVIDLATVLQVYTPEIVRFLFAGTRPNTEFTISFDLDVIKIYEDYDRVERIAWKADPAKDESTYQKARRIYELSQVERVPDHMPYQVPFRHLCNLLQIADGNIEKTIAGLTDLAPEQIPGIRARCVCAVRWIADYAPEEFRFKLRPVGEKCDLGEQETHAIQLLRDTIVVSIDQYPDDKSCAAALYRIAEEAGIEGKELFRVVYQALIGKDQGPRLANFLRSINRDRLLGILERY